MAIQHLKISNVRNITFTSLTPTTKVNLFAGDNGSGKTSLLEAVHFLAMARSFRTVKLHSLITKGQRTCTVYGELNTHGERASVGVRKSIGAKKIININGNTYNSNAELAGFLPVQLMDPELFSCLQFGPAYRRKLINWGAFYQTSSFFNAWRSMLRCLKHRNSLLKKKQVQSEELHAWTKQFISFSNIVYQLHKEYIKELVPEVQACINRLTHLSEIEISYSRGWSKKIMLSEAIERDLSKDAVLGYTTSGPHKSDMKITYKGLPASDVLSRGQQKMVVCAIKLAQGKLYEMTHQQACIYLIDDLTSELDEEHGKALVSELNKMRSQVWVTGVDKDILKRIFFESEAKMFHVKHGTANAV